jgi:hypothetical protein
LVSSKRPPERQQRRKPAPGAARARVVAAELLDEFLAGADHPVAAFDLGLARGNPRRRLLIGSKGRLGVTVAVHDGLLGRCSTPEASREGKGGATRFPAYAKGWVGG